MERWNREPGEALFCGRIPRHVLFYIVDALAFVVAPPDIALEIYGGGGGIFHGLEWGTEVVEPLRAPGAGLFGEFLWFLRRCVDAHLVADAAVYVSPGRGVPLNTVV